MAVTFTVGSGSRNYSTLALAEAAIPANISSTGVNSPYILSLYNDSEFYSSSGAILTISGIITDSTNTITITAAAGQSFADTTGNPLVYNQSHGVGLRVSTGYADLLDINNVSNVIITRLQMYLQGYGGVYVLNMGSYSETGNKISNCIFQASGSTGTLLSTQTTPITNCLFLVLSSGLNGIASSYGNVTLINCTIAAVSDVSNTAIGIGGYHANYTIINSAIFGFGTNAGGTSTTYPSSSNNASDQAIGFGSSNQPSLTYANQFVGTTTSTADYRLKSGSALLDAGITETTYIPSATDIVGTSRPQGTAWDIGCFELILVATFIAQKFKLVMQAVNRGSNF